MIIVRNYSSANNRAHVCGDLSSFLSFFLSVLVICRFSKCRIFFIWCRDIFFYKIVSQDHKLPMPLLDYILYSMLWIFYRSDCTVFLVIFYNSFSNIFIIHITSLKSTVSVLCNVRDYLNYLSRLLQ